MKIKADIIEFMEENWNLIENWDSIFIKFEFFLFLALKEAKDLFLFQLEDSTYTVSIGNYKKILLESDLPNQILTSTTNTDFFYFDYCLLDTNNVFRINNRTLNDDKIVYILRPSISFIEKPLLFSTSHIINLYLKHKLDKSIERKNLKGAIKI